MASHDLPSDMIFEVLSRITLKTLDRCKCVSKGWKHQIDDDPCFMPIYCQRTKNLSGFFIQDERPDGHVSKFASVDQSGTPSIGCLPRDTRTLASCDQGILCCVRAQKNRNHRYYTHKPSTGQWQALPNPKLRYWTVEVGMTVSGSNPLRFNIVRLSKKGFTKSCECYQYRCEIFDSTSWTWKETQTLTLPYSEHINSPTLSIYAKTSFHWLTTENNMITFHEPTKSFHTFPLPEPMLNGYNGYRHKKLVDYQGRFGLSCFREEGGKVELWLMEGDPICMKNGVEWRKHMSVDIGRLEESFACPYPAGFYKGGILLLKAFDEMVFYRLQDCTFSVAKLDFDFGTAHQIFQFRSDLDNICFRSVN